MSRRAISARRANAASVGDVETTREAALLPDLGETEIASAVNLPRDHPRWSKDRFTVTAATKALIDRLRPIAIRVFGFWDHKVHRLALDGSTLEIDASGSYRCDSAPRPLEN